MRRSLVAGNWKMNGTAESARRLAGKLVSGLAGSPAADVVVCPPFVHLALVGDMLGGVCLALGAQDVSDNDCGAFTGEIAAPMLSELGCRYVIVGHSERRAFNHESDDRVARKFAAVLRAGMTPILCVGETLAERESGETEVVVARQLAAVLALDIVAAGTECVIAYEPVWAIGTGRTATPEQASAVHGFIRAQVAGRDAVLAERVRILYGGSVKADNALALFRMPDIDGGLIGGASLDAGDFLAICQAAG